MKHKIFTLLYVLILWDTTSILNAGNVVILSDVANYIDFQALYEATPTMTEHTVTNNDPYELPNGSVLRGCLKSNGSETQNSWFIRNGYTFVAPTPEWSGVDSLKVGTMFRAGQGTTISLGAFYTASPGKLVVYYQPNGDSERGVSISVHGEEVIGTNLTGSGAKIDGIRPIYAGEIELAAGNYDAGDVVIKLINNTSNIFGVRIERFSKSPKHIKIGDLYYNLNYNNQTAEVTYQGGYYDNYSGLITANIPYSVQYCGISYRVISIGSTAFAHCSSISSISIPSSVTSIGNDAFWDCPSLNTITIPSSITEINPSAFADCVGLVAINVDSDNNNYCSINGVLFNKDKTILKQYPANKNGTTYTILGSVNTIEMDAFRACQNLTSITIPNSVTSIEDLAFCFCPNLTSISIPNSVTSIGKSAFFGCSGLTSITIPNSVTSIEEYAFYNCSSLTSVAIPNSVTNIGQCAFYNCSVLTSVTIPNSVTNIGASAFNGCTGLASITIPNNVTSIEGYAFSNCTGLTSVYCNASVPPTLGEHVFEPVVDTLYVPANAVDAYKNSNWKDYFTYIYAICVVTFEDQLGNEISQQLILSGDSVVAPDAPDIYGYTFTGWDKDLSVVTDDMVVTAQYTRDAIDGLYYIYDQTQGTATLDREGNSYARMTKLEVPDKVYYRGTMFTVTAVGTQALDGCDRLAEVVIPNTVEDIQTYAFNGCSDLAHLTLGAGVRNIAAHAFNGCRRLEDITVYADRVIDLTATSFNNVGDKSYIPVYVPETRLQYYQRDQYWSEFNLQVKSAEVVPDMTSTSVIVEPEETTASLTWPETADAASYDLVIRDGNGDIICSLQFDKDGRLIGIDFGGGQNNVAERVMMPQKHESENGFGTTSGFRFTVTGLSQGTDYSLRLAANNESNMPLDIYTATFKTKGVNQNIDNVQGDDLQSTKVLRDGQILILCGDNVYTTQGQRIQ